MERSGGEAYDTTGFDVEEVVDEDREEAKDFTKTRCQEFNGNHSSLVDRH